MEKILKSKSQPLMIDASVLLVGVDCQAGDERYSFENMKSTYMDSLFGYFDNVKIHETVYNELDDQRRQYVQTYVGRNVELVDENGLYGQDPQYTSIFNKIARHTLFNYVRGQSLNRGDVYTLAYAAYYGMPFITTRDGSIITVIEEVEELNGLNVLGFEYLLAIGYLLNDGNKEFLRRCKSLYKSQCTPAIKRRLIPETFVQFLNSID